MKRGDETIKRSPNEKTLTTISEALKREMARIDPETGLTVGQLINRAVNRNRAEAELARRKAQQREKRPQA